MNIHHTNCMIMLFSISFPFYDP